MAKLESVLPVLQMHRHSVQQKEVVVVGCLLQLPRVGGGDADDDDVQSSTLIN